MTFGFYRFWLTTDITRPGETTTYRPLPKEALPNKTFYDKAAIEVDGERIEYGYMLQAHTDGDITFSSRNRTCS